MKFKHKTLTGVKHKSRRENHLPVVSAGVHILAEWKIQEL
jgi:hypothetical protein